MSASISIPRAVVSSVQSLTSKSGKPYKLALIFCDGAMGLLRVFVSDDATPPPVGQPISILFDASVGFNGDLRYVWNKDTKFKAL